MFRGGRGRGQTARERLILTLPSFFQVYICRPRAPGIRATFYKSMLPEIPLAISQPCHRFFHEEDFEQHLLVSGQCPYSRVSEPGDYGPL